MMQPEQQKNDLSPHGLSRRGVRALIALGGVLLAGACSGPTDPPGALVVEIEECQRYATAYRACFGGLGGEVSRTMDRHAAALRQGLRAAPARADEVRTKCVRGLADLQAVCR